MFSPCCFFEAADGVAMIALYFDDPGCESSPRYFSKMDDCEPSLCGCDGGSSGEFQRGVALPQADEKKCALKRHSESLTPAEPVGVDRAPMK